MTEISPEVLEHLSYNAQQWAAYFEVETTGANERDTVAVAFGKVRQAIFDIVMKELTRAIGSNEEFQREPLRKPLIKAFSDPRLVKVTVDGRIYFNAKQVAGDSDDFWDGVMYARAMMDTGGKQRSPAQKAAFWRVMVYPSYGGGWTDDEYDAEGVDADEDLWSKTIAWRRAGGWGGLAPYWIILEEGNTGSPNAYPPCSPTNFLGNALIKAQGIFDVAMENVELQVSNIISDTANRFIENPEAYNQFDVLGEFYAQGAKYYIYITSTHRVGVALPSTYRGLSKR